jgi:hypothetical protein
LFVGDRFLLGRRVHLANASSLLWIVDHQPLAAEGVFEQLPLGRANTPNVDPFAQDQSFDDDQSLLIHGYDEGAIVVPPRLDALGHHLADGFVFDRYFLAVGVHLQSAGRLVDLGMDLNLTELLGFFVSDQAFFAQFDSARRFVRDALRLSGGCFW